MSAIRLLLIQAYPTAGIRPYDHGGLYVNRCTSNRCLKCELINDNLLLLLAIKINHSRQKMFYLREQGGGGGGGGGGKFTKKLGKRWGAF